MRWRDLGLNRRGRGSDDGRREGLSKDDGRRSLSGNRRLCRACGIWRGLIGGRLRRRVIPRRHHGDIPLEWFLQQCELHLLKQDQRSEHQAPVEPQRNQPSGLVRLACAQPIVFPGLCHNRITSRLTC